MPSSIWRNRIVAMARKEAQSLWRSRTGLWTAALFCFTAATAVGIATFGQEVSPWLGSGLIWVTLLFAAAVNSPQTFAIEQEQGTLDLLRTIADPYTVYWGKSLVAMLALIVLGGLTCLLLVALLGLEPKSPGWLLASILAGAPALAGTMTLSGALTVRAEGRSPLAAAIALPLVMPVAFLGIAATRSSLAGGALQWEGSAVLGLLSYAAISQALGPYLLAAVWRER